MTVADVIAATGARLVAGDASSTFEGLDIDSRAVPAGGAFVAFKGESVDGNRFAASALDDGAALVVLTDEPSEDVLEAARRSGGAILRAADDDGEAFMLAIAGAWRQMNPHWVVVGVTGSVGKTTTKDMLAAAAGACRRTHATAGNFNNLLGVPLTLMRASAEDEVLVVEMGMNHAGELERIAACARPDVALITNVGTSHIGNLGSREAIARAKAEVISGMLGVTDASIGAAGQRTTQEKPVLKQSSLRSRTARGHSPAPSAGPLPKVASGVAVPATLVLTDDDDYSDFIEREFARPAGVRVLRVGTTGHADVRAAVDSTDEEGRKSVRITLPDGAAACGKLPLPGAAMVADALSAMGAAYALGLDAQAAFDGLCAMKATHMRLDIRQNPGTPRVIDDSYNASPASIAASLDVLCAMRCEGRRVAVIGEVGELGDEAPRLHGFIGAYAAAKPLDLLVLVGTEDAAHMREAARTMGMSEDRIESFADAQEAARVMVPVLREDDLVLVKASRSVGLDLFAREVLNA